MALCSAPGAIGPNDTVMQFANQSASGSKGAIGTKGVLNARLPGTVYYDFANKGLMLCDGTNWVSIQSSAGGSASPNAVPVGDIWETSHRDDEVGQVVTVMVPITPEGKYSLNTGVLIRPSGTSNCSIHFQTPSGYKEVARVYPGPGGNTNSNSANATWSFVGRGDGTFAYERTEHTPKSGATVMGSFETMKWTGRVRFTGHRIADCVFGLRLMRAG